MGEDNISLHECNGLKSLFQLNHKRIICTLKLLEDVNISVFACFIRCKIVCLLISEYNSILESCTFEKVLQVLLAVSFGHV